MRLSKSKIDGMLYPCTKLNTIYNSFNHTGNVSELSPVNLYQFFNWENEDLDDSIYQLFTTPDNVNQEVGFSINKVIDIEDFKKLCMARGWLVTKLDVQNQLDIYQHAEEEIKFE